MKKIATEPLMPSDEELREKFGFVPPRVELEPLIPIEGEDDEPEEEELPHDDEEQI